MWGQNKNTTFKEIEKLQNKAIRIMCFKSKLEPTKPLYRDLKILRITDLLTLSNCQLDMLKVSISVDSNTINP